MRPSSPTTTLASTTVRRPAKRLKKAPQVNPASLLTQPSDLVGPNNPTPPASLHNTEKDVDGVPSPTEPVAPPSLPTSSSATQENPPAATAVPTMFNQVSQTISPGEVFRPTKPTPPRSTQLAPEAGTMTQGDLTNGTSGTFQCEANLYSHVSAVSLPAFSATNSPWCPFKQAHLVKTHLSQMHLFPQSPISKSGLTPGTSSSPNIPASLHQSAQPLRSHQHSSSTSFRRQPDHPHVY